MAVIEIPRNFFVSPDRYRIEHEALLGSEKNLNMNSLSILDSAKDNEFVGSSRESKNRKICCDFRQNKSCVELVELQALECQRPFHHDSPI